ncbi:MAG: hypothetical protein O7D34_02210 [Ignavibacteria bacterium]|nr:hypothetical protein [Ignavibacteria bacterium]
MSVSNDQVKAMVQKATGTIPPNPEVQAKILKETLPLEQPATPPGVEPVTPVETGLDPSTADFFGNLGADMDAEVYGTPPPEPQVPSAVPLVPRAPVEELPYEPPVHQRVPGEIPESLEPQPVEPPQLEAAIERPLAEEDVRLTADQWAKQQHALAPTPQAPTPVEQPQFDPVALEKQAIERLTTTEYALTEEDKVALISEPEKVLPGLAARMHVRMQVQLANQIAAILPGIIQGQLQQATKVQSLETSFFGEYPELNKPQFRKTTLESLAMIRQVNPQATREEVMRDGAALAAVRLRTRLGAVQEPAQMPALPQMPLAPTAEIPAHPVPAQPQVPFTPAQSGGASEPVVPTDPNSENIFTQLAMDPDW